MLNMRNMRKQLKFRNRIIHFKKDNSNKTKVHFDSKTQVHPILDIYIAYTVYFPTEDILLLF